MKTSKKILITISGILIAILITTMLVLRKDIKTLMETQDLIEYKAVQVEDFVALDFSTSWDVFIKQGKDCKVELAMKDGTNLQPKLENKSGTLFLKVEASPENNKPGYIYARVTAPILHEVRARGNTDILMRNFWSDSIHVVLQDSSKYSGKNNDFMKIIFKASANEESLNR
jgi:hypothetical protein